MHGMQTLHAGGIPIFRGTYLVFMETGYAIVIVMMPFTLIYLDLPSYLQCVLNIMPDDVTEHSEKSTHGTEEHITNCSTKQDGGSQSPIIKIEQLNNLKRKRHIHMEINLIDDPTDNPETSHIMNQAITADKDAIVPTSVTDPDSVSASTKCCNMVDASPKSSQIDAELEKSPGDNVHNGDCLSDVNQTKVKVEAMAEHHNLNIPMFIDLTDSPPYNDENDVDMQTDKCSENLKLKNVPLDLRTDISPLEPTMPGPMDLSIPRSKRIATPPVNSVVMSNPAPLSRHVQSEWCTPSPPHLSPMCTPPTSKTSTPLTIPLLSNALYSPPLPVCVSPQGTPEDVISLIYGESSSSRSFNLSTSDLPSSPHSVKSLPSTVAYGQSLSQSLNDTDPVCSPLTSHSSRMYEPIQSVSDSDEDCIVENNSTSNPKLREPNNCCSSSDPNSNRKVQICHCKHDTHIGKRDNNKPNTPCEEVFIDLSDDEPHEKTEFSTEPDVIPWD